MSSKSRNKKTTPPKRARAQEATPEPAEHHGLLDIPDELIHAPSETSKLRFVLMVALVVLLLVIFAIPGSIRNVVGRGTHAEPVEFQWERPGHGLEKVTISQSRDELRGLASALQLDPLIGFQLGITDRPDPEDGARIHVLDRLAEDAGVHITDDALRKHIELLVQFLYGNKIDAYERNLAAVGPATERIQLRRCLRVKRFLEMAGYAGAVPHPSDIEKLWRNDHTELALDWFSLPATDFADAARADLPDDAALQKWFDARPDREQAELKTPERRSAAVAVYRDATSTPAAGLLAAYPAPADADLEEQANDYYNVAFARRFVKPAEAKEGEEEGDQAPAQPGFYSFDEVRDQCLAEAPIYNAMQAWLDDLRKRKEAGEDIDFAAEATKNGLEVLTVGDETKAELGEDADLGAPSMVSAIFSAPLDGYSFLSMTKAVIGFGRVTQITQATLPPFEEIKDQVADRWIEPHSQELAQEHLKTIFDGFESFVPEKDPDALFTPLRDDETTHRRAAADAFAAAAQAAGAEVQHRDYLDCGGKADADPDHDDPAHMFLWQQRATLKALAEGEVSAPLTSSDPASVYLVRIAGKRSVPIEKMSPRDYERYESRARSMSQNELITQFDLAFLKSEYGLDFPERDKQEAGKKPSDAAPGEADGTGKNDDAPASE